MASPTTHDVIMVVGSLAAFALFWIVLCHIAAIMSGWHRLSEQFAAPEPYTYLGIRFRPSVVNLRFYIRYSHALTLGIHAEGLYLKVMFLFRTGHPPLLIPWREIQVKPPSRFLFMPVTTLLLGRDAQIPMRIYGAKAQQILAQSLPAGLR